jgi:DNA polymerase-3 subunit gamma/tau
MQLKGVVRELAMNCAIKERGDAQWSMSLDSSHHQLLSKERQQRLQEALCDCLKKSVQLNIELAGVDDTTPARQQQLDAATRQAAAVDTIEADSNVKAIQKAFDATLHPDSIRPLDS